MATEYLSKHIHHHLVVNAVNTGKETTADMIRELWTDRSTGGIRGNPKLCNYMITENTVSLRVT